MGCSHARASTSSADFPFYGSCCSSLGGCRYTSFWYRTHDPRIFRLAFPSLGHFVLAFLLLTRPRNSTLLLTQNVDGLHYAAAALVKEELQRQFVSRALTREKENFFLCSHALPPGGMRRRVFSPASRRGEEYRFGEKYEEEKGKVEGRDAGVSTKTSEKESSSTRKSSCPEVFRHLAPRGGWRGLGRWGKEKKRVFVTERRERNQEEKDEVFSLGMTAEGQGEEESDGGKKDGRQRERQVNEAEETLARQGEKEEDGSGFGREGAIDAEEAEGESDRDLFELHGSVYRYRCSGVSSSLLKEKITLNKFSSNLHGDLQGEKEVKTENEQEGEERGFLCPFRHECSLEEEEVLWVFGAAASRDEAQGTECKKRKKRKEKALEPSNVNDWSTGTAAGADTGGVGVCQEVFTPSECISCPSSLSGFLASSSSSALAVDADETDSSHFSFTTLAKRQRCGSASSVHTPRSSCSLQSVSSPYSSSSLSTSAAPIPLCPACHSLCLPLCLWFDESVLLPSHACFDSPAAFRRAFFFLANCELRAERQAPRRPKKQRKQRKENHAGRGKQDYEEPGKRKKGEDDFDLGKAGEEAARRDYLHTLNPDQAESCGQRDGLSTGEAKFSRGREPEAEGSSFFAGSGLSSGEKNRDQDSRGGGDALAGGLLSQASVAYSKFSQAPTDDLNPQYEFSWRAAQESLPTLVFLGTSFSTASTDWPLALHREATSALVAAKERKRSTREDTDCRRRDRSIREPRCVGGDVYSVNVSSCIEASYEVTSDQREVLKSRYTQLFNFWCRQGGTGGRAAAKQEEEQELSSSDKAEGVRLEGWRGKERVTNCQMKAWKDDKRDGDGAGKETSQIELDTGKRCEEERGISRAGLQGEGEELKALQELSKKDESHVSKEKTSVSFCPCPASVQSGEGDKVKEEKSEDNRNVERRSDSTPGLVNQIFPSFLPPPSQDRSSGAPAERAPPQLTARSEGGARSRLKQEVEEAPRSLGAEVARAETSRAAHNRSFFGDDYCFFPCTRKRYARLPSSWVESLLVEYASAGECDQNRCKTVIEVSPLTSMRRILGDASQVLLALCPPEVKAWIVEVHARLEKEFSKLISRELVDERERQEKEREA